MRKGRIIFELNGIVKPNNLVLLHKLNTIKYALGLREKGHLVTISDKLYNDKLLSVKLNDVESELNTITNFIGKIVEVRSTDEVIVDVPSIRVDGFVMRIILHYDNLKIVKVSLATDYEFKTKGDIKIFDNNNVSYYNSKIVDANQIEVDNILKNGYSDLTLIDMVDSEDLFNKQTTQQKDAIQKIMQEVENADKELTQKSDFTFKDVKELDNKNIDSVKEFIEKNLKDKFPNIHVEAIEIVSDENTFVGEYNDNNHVMIDMETLSVDNDAVILEISLAQFTPLTGEIHSTLKVKFDVKEQINELGKHISYETLFEIWLRKYPKEAQDKVLHDDTDRVSFDEGWQKVFNYLNCIEEVHVWGKGPTFDNAKLRHNLKQWGDDSCFAFYNERCVRTVLALDSKLSKSLLFNGTKHESMSDVEHQIKQVSLVLSSFYYLD